MRRVALPGAIGQSLVATLLGHPGRRRLRLGLVGRHRLRPGDLGREHRRPHPRPRRQRRPAHADRAHRGRLARRRRPLHRPRARAAAGPLRPGRRRGRGVAAGLGLAVAQARRDGGPDLPRRRAAHPLAARPRGRHPVAGAVHPDRPRRGPRHRRRLGEALRRLDGPRRVPRRHGRRPVGVQPPGGDRGAADARRLRRPLLRLGRHALQPAAPGRIARRSSRPRWRSSCSASRSPPSSIVLLLEYPLRVALSVAVALAQIGEFSFILATAGEEPRRLRRSGHQHPDRRAIISITLNPILYRLIDPLESLLAAVREDAGARGHPSDTEPRRPTGEPSRPAATGPSSSATAPSAGPWRGCSARTSSSRSSSS